MSEPIFDHEKLDVYRLSIEYVAASYGIVKGRNCGFRTQEADVMQVTQFARYFGRSPAELGAEEVRQYLLDLLNERRLNTSTVNQCRCRVDC